MQDKVNVVGVGMVKFGKPGRSDPYNVMASQAAQAALADAGVSYDQIEQAFAGYVFGDSTCGQRALYEVGLTGIPIFNVNNNCATGSTALFMAKQFIEGGLADCAMALGFGIAEFPFGKVFIGMIGAELSASIGHAVSINCKFDNVTLISLSNRKKSIKNKQTNKTTQQTNKQTKTDGFRNT